MKKATGILAILVISILVLTACTPTAYIQKNPYGNGQGDITVMGAGTIDAHFRRITLRDNRVVDDIDELKIWYQMYYSNTSWWTDYTIVWIGGFSAFEEFLYRVVLCFSCREQAAEHCIFNCIDVRDGILDLYTAEFFEGNNLVLIAMTEGLLTTGIRVDGVNENGVIDITRTIFNDMHSRPAGVVLSLSLAVDNDLAPDTMSVNMRTNRVRR